MRTSEPRDPRRSRGSVASGAGSSSSTTAAPAGTSRWWAWLGLTVVAAVVVAAVLRALTGPVYLVPSGSMEPTLQPGDRVRVDAAAAGGQGLHHGDVVVFDGAGSLAPYRSVGSLERGLEDVARSVTTESIADHLYTAGQPDPDLVIRTSGEQRLSGFLMWQSAHSEFYFCEAYWPDFRKVDLLRALRAYGERQRRYGA